MSINAEVIAEICRIAGETQKNLPPLTDDLPLARSGLDSLAIAVLVTRLEGTLGLDPFSDPDFSSYPVTLGDFVRSYERAASR